MVAATRPAYDDPMRRGLPALISVVAACASAAAPPPVAHRAPGSTARPPAWPDDVAALEVRWEACHHWAGEEPYDDERRREIAAGVAASCPGNDVTRAALLDKYADRPDVVRRLRDLPE